jgi:hypothetical protein
LISLACHVLAADAVWAAERIDFNRDVRQVLAANCFQCHGPDAQARQADLRLDDAAAAQSVIAPGDPAASEFVRRIRSTDPQVQMPPPESKKSLTAAERATLEQWIAEGAEYQSHWAFITPRHVQPPVVASDWPRNPIDRFVVARLLDEGLEPSPEADRATLLRRVSLDLGGLPPTPEEVAAYLAEPNPDVAYERAVDRLLASPRYGEHHATYWLEAARYADTDGYQNDRYRYQHAWRDWVILALNQNMPYDQFVVEQLAGDLLPGATLTQQIATGFCRNHRINSEDGSIPDEWHVENVVDRVDTLGTVFLGLTVGCGRCHDHKYDPLSQREYYQLFAYFNNVPEWGVGPNNGNSPPFVAVPANWPNLSAEENRFVAPEPVQLRRSRENENGNGLRRPQAGSPDTVMVMAELPERRATYRLQRGQYNAPDKSELLAPGVPQALGFWDESPPANRLELAYWLVHPEHPLTARVAVNRCWQQHFGLGLVKSSDNFGAQGEPPSHPELLDWLAREFIRTGWDVKQLHKLLVMSATYRQSSAASPELTARDPENRLLAHAPRLRLPASVLRDQVLAASGLLVDEEFGPPVKPYMPPGLWESISNNKYEQDHGAALYRRTLYTYWRRTIPPPLLMTLNAGDREVCVVRKDRTNTPLQALSLMNNVVFVEAARHLAERMLIAGGDPAESIRIGVRLVLGREPSATELAILQRSHAEFRDHFHHDATAARRLLATGESPRSASLEPADHAAMTLTASLLLNLDEAMTRE